MENRPRRKLRKPLQKTARARKINSNQFIVRTDSRPVGFASSPKFITAVSKIYHQEEKDIERFLKFAECYKSEK